jgi:hypothetical protein
MNGPHVSIVLYGLFRVDFLHRINKYFAYTATVPQIAQLNQ